MGDDRLDQHGRICRPQVAEKVVGREEERVGCVSGDLMTGLFKRVSAGGGLT